MKTRISEWVFFYALSVGVALVISALIVEATGDDWRPVVDALIDGSFRGAGRWGPTLGAAAPMLIVALGTVVSSRAGLVNIGQEGQLLMGTAFAVYFGFLIGGPGPVNLVLLMIFGAIGGAVWAGIAGVLRFWRGVPEVLTTLLLVTVSTQAVAYGLRNSRLLLAGEAARGNRNQVSEQLATNNRLPELTLFGNQIPFAVFLSLLLTLLLTFVLGRAIWGYRLQMVGRNQRTAHRFGVSQRSYGMAAIAISGAFAGLAGAVMLAGGGFQFGQYRLVPGFSANIGFAGLLVALVARGKPLATIPVALAFGALRTGAGFVSSTGVETRITEVVQGLLVLALLVPPAVMFLRDRRRARNATRART